MRTLLSPTLLLTLLPFGAAAQHDLSASPQHSAVVYAYRLTTSQAEHMYSTNLNDWKKVPLPPPADSFSFDESYPARLAPGNYLFLQAVESQLQVTLQTVGALRCDPLANGNTAALVLRMADGRTVTDAEVSVKGHVVPFDPVAGCYLPGRWSRSRLVRVRYQGAVYFFPVSRRSGGYGRRVLSPALWRFWRRVAHPGLYHSYRPDASTRFEARWRSFFVLSKPRYKPDDILSGKAFIINRKGRPYGEPLALRLSGGSVDTILQTLVPYRPGGYSFSFVLTDSLKMRLDDRYYFSLELPRRSSNDDDDPEQRRVLSRASFQFEEYNLSSVRLEARGDRKDQWPGEAASVYLQALDENDLPVPDGRVEVVVRAGGASEFREATVFVKDILWEYSQPLDPVGETRIILPDSIFPRASFPYTVSCRLLTSDNETDRKTVSVQYHGEPAHLVFLEHGDSLDIGCRVREKAVGARAMVRGISPAGEVVDSTVLGLPGSLRVNAMVDRYTVEAVANGDTIRSGHVLQESEIELTVHDRRSRDSVEFVVGDPWQLPFWYSIRMGDRLIQRGYGDRLEYRQRAAGEEPYRLLIQYWWKGVLRQRTVNLPFFDRQLNIDVRQPRFVYPGQRISIAVAVTDSRNQPVPNTDLTAFAWTAKFKQEGFPDIPYLGKQYRRPATGSYLVKSAEGRRQQRVALDWPKWRGVFGLDTIEYYRFLNPGTLYLHRERMVDGVTQVAPFVSRRGQPETVHLLYIDERLVFVHQAEQQRRYSFPATPGYHTIRIRVTNRELRIDSVFLPAGMKTFIGINDDTANHSIHIQPMPDSFLIREQALLNQSMITLQNTFSGHFATVRQGDGRMYLFAPGNTRYSSGSSLAGPFNGAEALLEVKDGWRQYFDPEGGNQFIIQPGLIKEKEWPSGRTFGGRLSSESQAGTDGLGDRALTGAIADSLWQDWLDERSANQDLYFNEGRNVSSRGRLLIGAPANTSFVKKVFVFRYDDADYLHVFRGRARELGNFETGVYRVLLLLKGDRYLLHDSVRVHADGLNYYGFDSVPIKDADAFSRRIAGMLRRLEDQWVNPHGAGMDSLRRFFSDRYLGPDSYDQDATGIVMDAGQQPMPGVTVRVKGTKQITVTDEKGRFRLRTPGRGTLVFLYVGFEQTEVAFTHPDAYTITMRPASHALNDVVVVGYGIARKRELTGSVSMLTGKVAGLEILGPETGKQLSLALSFNDIPPMPGLDTVRSIRRNFRDDAFWQPRLRTDGQGMASFAVTYPDDITQWNTFFIAVGDHGQTGYAAAGVRSLKPLSARLSNPNFLIAGDSAMVIGKLLNYGADTVTVDRRFSIGEHVISNASLRFRNARIDSFWVTPAAGSGLGGNGLAAATDSIRLSYSLQRADGYFDGEERSIPIFPAGTVESRGQFAALEGDTSLRWSFDSALGPVHIHAEASLLPVLLDEIESIRQYEYLCNEQLASKLLALLQKQHIYRLQQREFKEDKNIRDIIARLMKARQGKASWGWWAEGASIPWISLHVTQALLGAEKAGYATGLDKQALIDFLVYNYEGGTRFDRLFDLRMMQELGAKVDYRRYADSALKYLDRRSLYQTLRYDEICQAAGLPIRLDTLVGKRQVTALGNCYWGEDSRFFFENNIQVTLLFYRLLERAGGYDPLLHKTRNWLLERRGTGHWRNTYESSLILETLLPGLLAEGGTAQPPALTLNGSRITDFPYEAALPAGATVDARKTGALPVYFTAWQQFFNPAPERVDGTFIVRSWFEQGDERVRRLRSGKPTVLAVEVEVTGDAEYVMIEAPIPAGCTYSEKEQSFGYQVIHSEYFKNKLSIFCQSLGKGKHVFRIQLLPRWTGVYRLNPARAELMYFPVLYGREEMKRTVIE